MRIRHMVLLPCIGCGLAGMSTFSLAQTAGSRRADNLALEEVIVTAQKRSENIQEVPISVTALTAEKRDLVGIKTIEDMTNFVPGLTYEGQLDRTDIRGVGRVINAPGTDPGVGLYTDGVYNSSTVAAGRSTLFVDRIEVLRGPQSSLYGRNTTGGAINTVTRLPNDTFGSEFRVTAANYDRKIIEGTVTGPIVDWLNFRATGNITKQDNGYFTNIAPGHDSEGGDVNNHDFQGVLAAKFGDKVDLTLRYTHLEFFQHARFSSPFTTPNYVTTPTGLMTGSITTPVSTLPVTLSPSATTFTGRTGFQPSSLFNGTGTSTNPQTVAGVYTVANPASPDNRRVFNANVPTDSSTDHSNGYSATTVFHLPFADLKWIGAYTEYKFHSFSDTDAIGREFYDYTPPGASTVRIYTGSRFRFFEDKEYTSNELNLTSTGDGPLRWLVGLYQYHENYEQVPIALETSNPDQFQLHTVYARPAALIGAPLTAAQQISQYNAMTQVAYDNPNGATASSTGVSIADSYAAFGQVDWKFTDKWKLTVGGRLSDDEKKGYEKRFAIIWDPSVAGAAAKAYDNSAPLDCFTDGKSSYADPRIPRTYQKTVDVATGQEVAVAPVVSTVPGTSAATANLTGLCRTRTIGKLKWTDWAGDLGIEWKPTDETLAYAKYSRGYKSGAVRFGSFSLDAVTEPEHINAFEIGVKTTLAKSLQINSAVYYYDYHDYQFPVTEQIINLDGTTTNSQSYRNIDKAATYGLELESIWNPWSTLSLWLTYSYLHTEIKSDLYLVDPNDATAALPDASKDTKQISPLPFLQVAQNVKGSELPGSPKHKVSLNVNYTWNFSAGSLTPSASYSWRSSQSSAGLTVSPFSRKTNSTPAYSTTDARLTWVDSTSRYTIDAFIANVLDDTTVNSASIATINGQTTQIYNLNPPRTWGIEAQYRFGSDRH